MQLLDVIQGGAEVPQVAFLLDMESQVTCAPFFVVVEPG